MECYKEIKSKKERGTLQLIGATDYTNTFESQSIYSLKIIPLQIFLCHPTSKAPIGLNIT
jgi:hypothetical protein